MFFIRFETFSAFIPLAAFSHFLLGQPLWECWHSWYHTIGLWDSVNAFSFFLICFSDWIISIELSSKLLKITFFCLLKSAVNPSSECFSYSCQSQNFYLVPSLSFLFTYILYSKHLSYEPSNLQMCVRMSSQVS